MKVSWRAGPLPAHWRGKLGLGPLVGSAMSRGMPRGGSGLRTVFTQLSDDGWDC